MTHGKTYNKSPRRINHKATKSKTNTGSSLLYSPILIIVRLFGTSAARQTQKNWGKKLQFRALRIVFSDYTSSYEELFNRVQSSTLHMIRLHCIAAEAYKCINNISPVYLRDLVEIKQSNYTFRYQNTAKLPTVRTVTYGRRSFRFESARVWNSLPNDIRTAESFN